MGSSIVRDTHIYRPSFRIISAFHFAFYQTLQVTLVHREAQFVHVFPDGRGKARRTLLYIEGRRGYVILLLIFIKYDTCVLVSIVR